MKLLLKISSMACFALIAAGCGNHYQFGLTNEGQDFKQGASGFTNQLDILWVVDNSSSMEPLQANMVNNFNSFISNFQAKDYDFRMAVTTSDAYKANSQFVSYTAANAPLSLFQDGAPGASTPSGVFVIIPTTPNLDATFTNNATTGINGSGDERAFSSMMTALNNKNNPSFLRSSSFFAIIILSDEDDFSLYSRTEGSWGSNDALDHCYVDPTMDAVASTASYGGPTHTATCANQTPPDSVNSYVSALDTLTTSTGATRRYNVSTITVLDSACQVQHAADPNGTVTIVGQRYIQLAQATSGVTGSICDTSYAASLSNIANQIAVLSTQFFLSIVPNPSTISVVVNNVSVINDPNNGWTYNSTANSIQFHGTATPPQGADINVNFLPAAAAI